MDKDMVLMILDKVEMDVKELRGDIDTLMTSVSNFRIVVEGITE